MNLEKDFLTNSKNLVNTICCLSSFVILLLNLWFLHSPWIGMIFFAVYALFLSRVISLKLTFFDKDLVFPFSFLFLNMLFVIMSAIAIMLRIPLGNELIALFLLVPMLLFLTQKDEKNVVQTSSQDKLSEKEYSINPILLFVFSLSLIGMIWALWCARTGSTIPYFQQNLHFSFYIFNFLASILVIAAIFSRCSLRLKLIFLSTYSVVSHLFRYIIYVVMTGSDMWNNLITAWWIFDGNILLPHTNLYYYYAAGENAYLGLWGITVSFSRITGIDLYSLYPYIGLLLAFFVPLVLYQIVKILLNNDNHALLVSFMCSFLYDTFIWLALSSANGLGILAMLFSLLFWILYLKNEKMSIFLPLLITLSGILAYPLTGIYTGIMAIMSISIRKTGLKKNVIVISFLSCLVIPLWDLSGRIAAFFVGGGFQVPNFLPIDTLFNNFIFLSQRSGLNNLLDIPYLIVYLLVGIGIISGRRRIKREIYYLLLALLIIAAFSEAYGWWVQTRVLHRIGSTILPWLYLVFSGMSIKWIHAQIAGITPTIRISLRGLRRNYVIEPRKLIAFGLCLMFGFASTNNFVFSPTTNSYNPSTDLVNAVNYIISQDPSKESLVLADGYTITLLSAFSHASWYHYPGGSCLNALSLTVPMYTQVLSSPNKIWDAVQEGKSSVTNSLTRLGITSDINRFYYVYDAVLVKYLYGSISPDVVKTLSSILGEPTTFGNVYVYSSKIPTILFNATISDVSGNKKDGVTRYGPIIEEGVVGKGIKLDGINDYIEAPALNLTDAFTFEAWIYFIDGQPFGDFGDVFDMVNTQHLLRVLLKQDKIEVQMFIGVDRKHLVDSIDLRNAWHHIVATYDGKEVNIYVDKQLIYQKAQTGAIDSGTIKTYIGRSIYPEWYHFKGSIDEIRVYNRALYSSEVAYSYMNKTPMDKHGLLLWYSFDYW